MSVQTSGFDRPCLRRDLSQILNLNTRSAFHEGVYDII